MLFKPPSNILENSKACYSAEMLDPDIETNGSWMYIFLGFITAYWTFHLFGLFQQYREHRSFEQCRAGYGDFDFRIRELYPWAKVKESIKYNRDLFGFLIVRTVFCEVPLYLMFFMCYGPAHMWNMWTGRFLAWGWCEDGDGSWNLQLLCGIFGCITFKALEKIIFTPWAAYQDWKIDKFYELMEPTVGSFLWGRFAELLQFMLTLLPIALLIVKVIQWVDKSQIWVVFLFGTSIVKLTLMCIYPWLVQPLESEILDIPEYAQELVPFMQKEARIADLDETKISFERSFHYDVHVNASYNLGRITIGEPLIREHGKYPAEIIAIVTHELGHHKGSHQAKQILADTGYMVLYGAVMSGFVNQPNFLKEMGFPQQSYFASFILFAYLYQNSIDVPLRLGLNALSRHNEHMADLYACERGYGVALLNSLIRCHAKSLDSLFYGYIDHIIHSGHPKMEERYDAIMQTLYKDPDLREIRKQDLQLLSKFIVEVPKEEENEEEKDEEKDDENPTESEMANFAVNNQNPETEQLLEKEEQ